jgi:hypothetical protein
VFTKIQKCYTFGSKTIAMRTVQGDQNTLNWILADNLNSTTVTTNADGNTSSFHPKN